MATERRRIADMAGQKKLLAERVADVFGVPADSLAGCEEERRRKRVARAQMLRVIRQQKSLLAAKLLLALERDHKP